jgi:hypothetical protein
VGVHVDKSPKTRRLNRWTATHETTRRQYSRSRLSVTTSKANRTGVQTRVRSLITEHRQTPVLTDRALQRSTVSRKRNLPDTRNESNATIQRQRSNQRSASDRSAQSYRSTQRKRPYTRNESNTTIQRQRSDQRSASDISTRSYRSTQQILKRKRLSSVEREPRSSVQPRNAQPRTYQYDRFRFSPNDRRSSDNSDSEVSTRSNAERRVRLYNRTQSSRSRLSTPPSRSRSSSVKQSTETRSRSKQSRSRSSTTAPRVQRPTPQQTTSSSSSKDDDDEKRERSRNTTRTQTRSRRK